MSDLFSPLDTRYSKDLPTSLGEQKVIETQVEVEKVWLTVLMNEGLCPKIDGEQLDKIFAGVSQAEIDEIESRTQHATRALVEVLIERLKRSKNEEAASWVHVGLTSFDTVDTAQRLRLKKFFELDGNAALEGLKSELRRWATDHAETPQVGRTHGQWAVPSFFGLQFAEAHERIEIIEEDFKRGLENLRGQASGAVGGYQASALLSKDPLKLEEDFLKLLHLKPHYGSTQILPPEDILSLAQSVVSICSVVAKVATDLRHLARSEITEVVEGMGEGQVGSSTMPQKRNPWNLEHVCSLYKVLLSRLQLIQSDLISEHHRDLTNSASSRFYFEIFAIYFLMMKRMTRVLKRLNAYPEQMKKHLESAGTSIYAEAFYVLGSKNGIADAHDVVRQASRQAESTGKGLADILIEKKLFPVGMSLDLVRSEVLRGSRLKFAAISQKWNERY